MAKRLADMTDEELRAWRTKYIAKRNAKAKAKAEGMKAEGFVKICVYIPADCRDEFIERAAQARAEYRLSRG